MELTVTQKGIVAKSEETTVNTKLCQLSARIILTSLLSARIILTSLQLVIKHHFTVLEYIWSHNQGGYIHGRLAR